MSLKSITLSCLFLFGLSNLANAQSRFLHEIGAIIGPVAFQSDYGERHDLSTNAGNTGFGIGIIHVLNFSNADYSTKNYFNDHFKVRSELSYNKTKLNHFGQWIKGNPTLGKQQLKAMNGSTALTDIGMQLEYFPLSLHDFERNIGGWAPFVSLGAHFSFYDAKVKSTMGPLGTPSTTFPKYLTPTDDHPYGFSTETGTVWSVVSSIGTRYNLSYSSDLMIDLRWQYYTSDWVDGLKPNPSIYKENKANDWLLWLNIGYIYYLE
jgi:hypothetical protein